LQWENQLHENTINSIGWKNGFHFPHPSVIKRYIEIGARIYRTDLHGAIRMMTNGQDLLVEPTLAVEGIDTDCHLG
jgi:competence protein ComEC